MLASTLDLLADRSSSLYIGSGFESSSYLKLVVSMIVRWIIFSKQKLKKTLTEISVSYKHLMYNSFQYFAKMFNAQSS